MRNFLKRIFVRWKKLDGIKLSSDFAIELKNVSESNKEILSKIRKERLDNLHHTRLKKQKEGKGFYIFAMTQNIPVGYVYISVEGTQQYHTSPVLQDLYVKTELREQKIGSKMVKEVETFLWKKGYRKASLDVEVKMKWIRRIYENLGFELKSGPHLQSWKELDSGKKISIETWYLEKSLKKS